MPSPHRLRLRAIVGAAAIACSAVISMVPTSAAAASPAPALGGLGLCAHPIAGHRSCQAVALAANGRRVAASAWSSTRSFAATGSTAATPSGYSPSLLQSAYAISGSGGAGRTVAIVDAYDNPNAAADLAAFRTQFGLPSCTVSSGCFTKMDQNGGSTFYPASTTTPSDPSYGWSMEIDLDVQAVSSTCPACKILLVESFSSSDADLLAGIATAARHGANVISLSWGGCESSTGQASFDSQLQATGVPITVSTGDSGYLSPSNPQTSAQGCSPNTPLYPASSPYVTAVGGTTLQRSTANSRGFTESAWSYNATNQWGGGSGCSIVEPKPSWQTDSGCARRMVSDVAADADPFTGLAVYDSYDNGATSAWGVVGGTSLSSPLVAGIYGLRGTTGIDAARTWYGGSATYDITSGTNAPSATDCSPAYFCNAGAGYDGPTGTGSPEVTPPAAPAPPPASGFKGLYGVDGYGVLHPGGSPMITTATWSWNIARGVAVDATGQGGLTLDGWGGLHPWGDAGSALGPIQGSGYWPGWDIARSAVLNSDGRGFVLDGWGGVHSFAGAGRAPLTVTSTSGYWPGWDIARGIASFADGSGGVVLDGWGGVHPFGAGGAAVNGSVTGGAYWPGWDIARAVVLVPGSSASAYSGYILDGFGGLHPFASSGVTLPPALSGAPYWSGWDIARSVVLSAQTPTQGYMLDGIGGFHPLGGASPVATPNYGVNAGLVTAASAS